MPAKPKTEEAGKQVLLRDLLLAQQAELTAGLDAARKVVNHPTDLGTIVEVDWCKTLRSFLPARYSVNKATIVDYHGAISDAIDVVVYDELHSPLLFEKNGVRYIPIESVYGVFEVKQGLTRAHVIYAGKKAASVRRLEPTSAPFINAGGSASARAKTPIITGILTTSSSWKDPLGRSLTSALKALSADESLDLGCALHDGAFSVNYAERGFTVDKSIPEASSIFFLMKLFERLRPIGTVAAIDLDKWGRSITD